MADVKRSILQTAEMVKKGQRYVAHVSHTELLEAIEEGIKHSFAAFFDEKAKWSLEVIGPIGEPQSRTPKALAQHIRKEAAECEKDPTDIIEWADVAMIAMDGAMRFAGASGDRFLAAMRAKHEQNVAREWPDWRTADPEVPLEHTRQTGPIVAMAIEELDKASRDSQPKVYGLDALIRGETPPMTEQEAAVVAEMKGLLADTKLLLELDEVKRERDRWEKRVKVLEERLSRITNIACGRGE